MSLGLVTLAAESASHTRSAYPVFWMFAAVLVTFVVTRLITIRIKSRTAQQPGDGDGAADRDGLIGDISIGGVHIHHQVFGIFLMLGGGLALVAVQPEGVGLSVAAAVFGVGVGLVFDEFALWLHLEDVYWSAEGRQSIDAIFCVLVITGALIGSADLLSGKIGSPTWWASVGYLAFGAFLSLISALKGKFMSAIIGIVVSPVSLVAAIRLAKPQSWWSRRFYASRPRRRERSAKRFGAQYDRRWNRLRDIFAGPR